MPALYRTVYNVEVLTRICVNDVISTLKLITFVEFQVGSVVVTSVCE